MADPRDRDSRPELLPPARRLGDLRKEPVADDEVRLVLGRAAIEIAGEVGYAALTVERIIARARVSRAVFYRLFDGAPTCYLAGYEEGLGLLVRGLLAGCRDSPDWRSGVGASLDALAGFLTAQTFLADGLILQAAAAGGLVVRARERLLAPLAIAIESGRPELAGPGQPPEIAPSFLLGAIEAAAIQALSRRAPESFTGRIPDLLFLVTVTYLGREGNG